MVVEEAKNCHGKVIGWRLNVGTDTLLVFVDQEGMPGFRQGNAFVPGYGDRIEYEPVFSSAYSAVETAPEHRCGVQGFDQMKGDVCPACTTVNRRTDHA